MVLKIFSEKIKSINNDNMRRKYSFFLSGYVFKLVVLINIIKIY